MRQQLHTRAFLIMFEVLVFIAAPAAGAAFLGRYLENSLGTGAWLTYTLLALGFVLSWVLILVRLRYFNRILKAVESEYFKRSKSLQGNDRPGKKEDGERSAPSS